MLTVYLIVLSIGVIAFFISSYADLRKFDSKKSIDNRTEELQRVDGGNQEPVESRVSVSTPQAEELRDIKQALLNKLDQKCIKLENILEEKNRILAQLQKDLENERSHRGEFESLRAILQQQIDDIKAQNKNLKDELERSLQENLKLQTGITIAPLADIRKAPISDDRRDHQPDSLRKEADDIIPVNPNNISQLQLNKTDLNDSNTLPLINIIDEENKSKGAGS